MTLRIPKSKQQKPHIAQRHAATQEKRVAASLGAKPTKGSGCGDERGDSRRKGIIRVENKCTTSQKGFRVTVEIIEKIENAALQSGEVPAIEVEFIDKETGAILHEWAIVPVYVLKDIVERYINYGES